MPAFELDELGLAQRHWGQPAGGARRRVVASRAPALPVRALSPPGWAPWPRARAALLADGTSILGWENDSGGWDYAHYPEASVAAATRARLDPLGIRVVRGAAASQGVCIPLDSGWTVVWDRAPARDSARERTLLAAFGAAAVAAVAAFAFFVRAVRREAAAAAARADFVATVSHELRTPVAVVRTAAETLLADRAPRPEDRRQLIEAILRESERLSGLVGNVLDFSRIDAGTRRYAFRETSIEELVEETVRRAVPVLRPAGLRVDVSIPAPLPHLVCDPDALGAALTNLLDNAAKFRGSSDHAAVRTTCDGGYVTIEVEDHGVGIPDAEKAHVAERFFRGADPRVRETRGSGIGLSLVLHAAQAHGGRVEISDTAGGGTTVRLILPLRRS